MRRGTLRPAVATVSALAALAAVLGDMDTGVRAPLVFWFVLTGPGMTVVSLLRVRDPLLEVAATFAISLALGVGVAEALLYLDLWSSVLGLWVLSVLTLVGAAVSLGSAASQRRTHYVSHRT
jgi:hypothetical protein